MMDEIRTPIRLLVTHQNPDLDAIGACWLWRRFEERYFGGAELYFVPAGREITEETLRAKGMAAETVIHVDTGMGRFDHHQPGNTKRDSATMRVYEYLCQVHPEYADNPALERLVIHINEIDHFAECHWPEAGSDRYQFMLDEILKGLRSARHLSDHELVEFGLVCLDGVYACMKMKISAEEDLYELGQEMETSWGKGLAIENSNDEVMKVAQKKGYVVVVRKDAKLGHVRIKAVPDAGIDLSSIYQEVLRRDQQGTWYFHPSKTMLLNGSDKASQSVASSLELDDLIQIFSVKENV